LKEEELARMKSVLHAWKEKKKMEEEANNDKKQKKSFKKLKKFSK
jgi:hypothetical protein